MEHAGLLHFAGCSMHDAEDGMAVQTEGALARLQERLEERESTPQSVVPIAYQARLLRPTAVHLLRGGVQAGVGYKTSFRSPATCTTSMSCLR